VISYEWGKGLGSVYDKWNISKSEDKHSVFKSEDNAEYASQMTHRVSKSKH